MTAMDYRQYDNAIGRFNSMDALSEMQYSHTPYHFSGNNPVFFSDPSGLIQGGPMLNAMWDNTASGTNSFWQNDGSGLFTSRSQTSSTGFMGIDTDGTFYENLMNPVTLASGSYTGGILIQAHVYANGEHYNNSSSTLSNAGRINNGAGFIANTIENTPGSFRLTTVKQGFSPKYYSNAWRGNQYARTFNLGKIGTAMGWGTLGLGTAMDSYGVYQYSKDPTDPSAVHPAKMGLNLGVGLYGIYANPFFGALYGGAEALHPNGFIGAWSDDISMKHDFRKHNGYPLIIQR